MAVTGRDWRANVLVDVYKNFLSDWLEILED
jgi:hypothetical protein